MLDRLEWRPNSQSPDQLTGDPTSPNKGDPNLSGDMSLGPPSPLRSHRHRDKTPVAGSPASLREVKKKWTQKRLVLMDAAKRVQQVKEDQGEEGVAAMKIQGKLRQQKAARHSMKVKKQRTTGSGVLRSLPGAGKLW